jgi:23S rRNA (adenine1618-N6)-methyltransferase
MRSRQEAGPGLHPRNRHQGRYDFGELTRACPELGAFVRPNPYQDASIDFADPAAVRTLNRALLASYYGIQRWELPAAYLCPPIPGRADYIHHAADLLAADGGRIPRGPAVRVLDIGVGASCIYPILGHCEYGWRFLGSDIDPGALAAAARIVQGNPALDGAIELRLQPAPGRVFQGMLRAEERFDLVLCNPPFHGSPEEAREGTRRKLANLGLARPGAGRPPVLNFGGQGAELWCPGGEEGFLGRMIAESARIPAQCLWFSSLVSRAASLPGIRQALKRAGAAATRTLEMAQGQKRSRVVAWTFQTEAQRAAWQVEWGGSESPC